MKYYEVKENVIAKAYMKLPISVHVYVALIDLALIGWGTLLSKIFRSSSVVLSMLLFAIVVSAVFAVIVINAWRINVVLTERKIIYYWFEKTFLETITIIPIEKIKVVNLRPNVGLLSFNRRDLRIKVDNFLLAGSMTVISAVGGDEFVEKYFEVLNGFNNRNTLTEFENRKPEFILTEVKNEKNVCPKCGTELKPNAKFCSKCGERI